MAELGGLKVTVIDMQPITPAVGGGRLRLLGLYHGLGEDIDCTYVGSYDWQGESYRDERIRPGLREIVVPLSTEHHHAAAALSTEVGGVTVIDTAFPLHAALSPRYLEVAREHIRTADIVIFSHPWCYPCLEDALRQDQLVVYDSHNVEVLLKAESLGEIPAARSLIKLVAKTEFDLLRRADLVLTCSDQDAALYQRIFDVDPIKLRLVPNGTFVDRLPAPADVDRQALRSRLKLSVPSPVAIFLGSHYGPNGDAAQFIARTLAPACPEIVFVIAGGVGRVLAGEKLGKNVVVTGQVDDVRRDELLLAADFALNPMSAGSGTNIKMFDYMAAGLPTLTTEIGARGIGTLKGAPTGIYIEHLRAFPARCRALATELGSDSSLRTSVRETVRRYFSWELISKETGALLRNEIRRFRSEQVNSARLAMLTTWNVTCGIGEHAGFLADALTKAGAQVLVLGNDLRGHQALGLERDLHSAVSRVWEWDNTTWSDSRVDRTRLDEVLGLYRPGMLIIQHHSGFAPQFDIEHVVEHAHARGISVVIEMHDARNVSVESKNRFCALGAILVAHHEDELKGIEPAHRGRARVIGLPVQNVSDQRECTSHSSVSKDSIGGFGFLRPYKGLMVAIRTLAILRRRNPNLRYRGWHALYGGDESSRYLKECLDEAERLGVRDAIDIDTRFLSLEEVHAHLRTVDAVLMPYEPSEEGASAAVNLALAAGRPIVASPSAIFRSVSDVVRIAKRHDPDAYASELELILTDPKMAEEMAIRAQTWAECNSYSGFAGRLMALKAD
jgi:glycosyltransferase involved in cell wall biosynthesis